MRRSHETPLQDVRGKNLVRSAPAIRSNDPQKSDSGNRRQGGGGWGTPLKKRSATRIKSFKEHLFSGILNASAPRIGFSSNLHKHILSRPHRPHRQTHHRLRKRPIACPPWANIDRD